MSCQAAVDSREDRCMCSCPQCYGKCQHRTRRRHGRTRSRLHTHWLLSLDSGGAVWWTLTRWKQTWCVCSVTTVWSERFRGKLLTMEHYTNLSSFTFTFTQSSYQRRPSLHVTVHSWRDVTRLNTLECDTVKWCHFDLEWTLTMFSRSGHSLGARFH